MCPLGYCCPTLDGEGLFGNRLYGNTGPLSGVLDNLATLTTLSFPSLSVVMKGRRG